MANVEKVFGVIGGSGFYDFPELQNQQSIDVSTPYGDVCNIVKAEVSASADAGKPRLVFFLPRHGQGHKIPPHKINYRANIAALAQCGVSHILAFNAVGGISANCPPGSIVLPHQLIDYTYGREHTFYDGFDDQLEHLDFETPCDAGLRDALRTALSEASAVGPLASVVALAVYGCTQGPRLETAAEIKRLARDGCDVVGMTMMPEAALAAERKMAYASIGLVVNWAAGVGDEPFGLDNILALLNSSVPEIREILLKLLRFF